MMRWIVILLVALLAGAERAAIAADAVKSPPPRPPPAVVTPTDDGVITATLKAQDNVLSASALLRERTSLGVKTRTYEGKIDGDKVTFTGLRTPGKYDLQFTTESGTIEGWEWCVPASDYEEEQPLSAESRATIIKKMGRDAISGFAHTVTLLDLRGNIQHAAVLSLHVRYGSMMTSYGPSEETVWYVRRDEFENPEEHTWTPIFDVPYYNLHRERISRGEWGKQRFVFARHLGGIELKPQTPRWNAGIVLLPKVELGIRCINPDGSLVEPEMIKPRPATQPAVK